MSALEPAHRGDVVVIAGRGAEPEQELATGKVAFDDREVVRAALHLWRTHGKAPAEVQA